VIEAVGPVTRTVAGTVAPVIEAMAPVTRTVAGAVAPVVEAVGLRCF
jgi:hypothetical protein